MNNILITGIDGFLGSNLAEKLKSKYKIIGIEKNTSKLQRIKDNHYPVFSSDLNSINSLFDEYAIDQIIHTATDYGRINSDIQSVFNSNLFMPFILLDSAIRNNVRCFINTDTSLERFVSSYSLTKKQFSDWISFRKEEINIVNIELEHFYGKGCSETNFITQMIKRLSNNEPFINLTQGEQKRDFIYFTDVIDAFDIIIDKTAEFEEPYMKFCVGSGEVISIRDLMLLLKKLTKSNTELNFGAIEYRKNEVMESNSDNSSVKKLGWKPRVALLEGLKKTISR